MNDLRSFVRICGALAVGLGLYVFLSLATGQYVAHPMFGFVILVIGLLLWVFEPLLAPNRDAQVRAEALQEAAERLRAEWRSLPVWGPDERGLFILDGVDREGLMADIDRILGDQGRT